ncbi:efflux RND transporter periplasmic adaptor subunit [Leeia aquatica]|uniref:Efflux RND transporter periplasmic adaptor subunit n=1 Tax=Leeia aquatica TaxID=2725557 RepID=A0A847SE06_9NEIS|nr:efflux RND transporter periplasmic adaptor subunit [Leeia aquatica]NLR75519.1 efflux RND transporter periplasmic adaptor subunit [Leeia aquatica]
MSVLRRPWFWLLLLVLAALAALIVLRPGKGGQSERGQRNRDKGSQLLVLAEGDVYRMQAGVRVQSTPFTGSLVARRQTMLAAPMEGLLAEVKVRPGQVVKQGEVLAIFDERDLQARLQERKAAVSSAASQLKLAERNHQSRLALKEQGFISPNALQESQAAVTERGAALASQQSQLKLVQRAAQDAVIRAPFDGIIATQDVQAGQNVAARARLFLLVDPSSLEIEASLQPEQLPKVQIGMPARFSVEGLGEQSWSAQLSRIAPQTQGGARQIPVWLSLTASSPALRGGLFVSGQLQGGSQPVLLAPKSAISIEDGKATAWVVQKGKLQQRQLVLGELDDSGNFQDVRSGLQPGDLLVRVRLASAKPGQAVRVPKAGAPA